MTAFLNPVVLAAGLAFPEGPALSRDGRVIYCVNVQQSVVSRYDIAAHAFTRAWLTLPDGGRGNGATLGPDGALYIADVGARRIVRVGLENDPTPGEVTTIVDINDAGEPLLGPNDLIFAPDGTLYFTDPDGSWNDPIGAVYQFHPGSRRVSKIADGLRFPNGLVLSSDAQTLFVAISPYGRIDTINLASGELRPFVQISQHGGPDGMRLGPDGCLYVAVFGDGIIAQISPHGTVTARFPVGGQNPTNLCFALDGRGLYVSEAETNSLIYLAPAN